MRIAVIEEQVTKCVQWPIFKWSRKYAQLERKRTFSLSRQLSNKSTAIEVFPRSCLNSYYCHLPSLFGLLLVLKVQNLTLTTLCVNINKPAR